MQSDRMFQEKTRRIFTCFNVSSFHACIHAKTGYVWNVSESIIHSCHHKLALSTCSAMCVPAMSRAFSLWTFFKCFDKSMKFLKFLSQPLHSGTSVSSCRLLCCRKLTYAYGVAQADALFDNNYLQYHFIYICIRDSNHYHLVMYGGGAVWGWHGWIMNQ